MSKTALDQKKTIILMVLGIVVIVLAGVNRFFFDNIVMSGIVVTLSIIFFIALIWVYVSSRRTAVKAHPKGTKQNPSTSTSL